MRLFIGIKTGCEDHLHSLQDQLRRMGQGSFTYKENMHITLKFLGEVSPTKLEDVERAMAEIKHNAFHLECLGLGLFNKNGIVSAKVGGELNKLSVLQSKLETEFEKCGFKKENRKYRPHITLARRFEAFQDCDISSIPYRPTGFIVKEIILFESKRISGRLVYEPLYTTILG